MSAAAKPLPVLSITPTVAKSLSPAQKKFNSLVKRIAARREQLAQWEAAVPPYRERVAREFEPLLGDYRTLYAAQVRALHAAAGRKGLTKAERATLAELIAEQAGTLAGGAADDALRQEMKQLYNLYAGADFDAQAAHDEAMANEVAREMARQMFGVDIPDDLDLASPDEAMRHVRQQMQEKQEKQARADAQQAPAKPSKREQQAAELARQASQTVREVYRKLASQLHPDREPDAAERARKTVLMQRVNQAYAQNRLLDLLQLQLEAEQIDAAHIDHLGAQRLKHFNLVLDEQLAELEQEMLAVEAGFCMEFDIDPGQALKPGRLMHILSAQIAQLDADTRRLRRDMALFDEPAAFKRWLKAQREALRAAAYDDGLLDFFGR